MLKNYPNITDKNLRRICQENVGFHHAGMIRSDRNAVERMFQKG
jgi:replicative superfamily II helicase